jgi:hypothetical protein
MKTGYMCPEKQKVYLATFPSIIKDLPYPIWYIKGIEASYCKVILLSTWSVHCA